jgi:hypothetical protein
MKAPGLLFLSLYGKLPSLDGAHVVTDIENFQFNLGTFTQISQLSTEGQVMRQHTQKSKYRTHRRPGRSVLHTQNSTIPHGGKY